MINYPFQNFDRCFPRLTKSHFVILLREIDNICKKAVFIFAKLHNELLHIYYRTQNINTKVDKICHNFRITDFAFSKYDQFSSSLTSANEAYAPGEPSDGLPNISVMTSISEIFSEKANMIIMNSRLENKVSEIKLNFQPAIYPRRIHHSEKNTISFETEAKDLSSINSRMSFAQLRKNLHDCHMKAILKGVTLRKVQRHNLIAKEENNMMKALETLINSRFSNQSKSNIKEEDCLSLASWKS